MVARERRSRGSCRSLNQSFQKHPVHGFGLQQTPGWTVLNEWCKQPMAQPCVFCRLLSPTPAVLSKDTADPCLKCLFESLLKLLPPLLYEIRHLLT